MRKLGLGFVLALLIGWQNSDVGDPVEPSGGVSWPLTAQGTLDMDGNSIEQVGEIEFATDLTYLTCDADAQLEISNQAQDTGVTLDVDDATDTLALKDLAGTGAADLYLPGGEILMNGLGGNNPKMIAGSDSVTFIRQNGTAESIVVAREFQADSKITLTSPSIQLRWSGASQMDSGGADGRIRIRDASGSNGTCFIVSSNTFDARQANCSSPAEMIGRFGVNEATTPTIPGPCNATTLGYREVVNDSDDGAGTEVCYCGMTDDVTYDWLNIADNTACSFY